jgi:primosomal protein N'
MGALEEIEEATDLPFPQPDPNRPGAVLTAEQASAAEELREGLQKGGYAAYLLDGVTGSGKTEVYFEAIADVLRADPEAQILVLLPEIALTQAILARFEARFGAAPAPWHLPPGRARRRQRAKDPDQNMPSNRDRDSRRSRAARDCQPAARRPPCARPRSKRKTGTRAPPSSFST